MSINRSRRETERSRLELLFLSVLFFFLFLFLIWKKFFRSQTIDPSPMILSCNRLTLSRTAGQNEERNSPSINTSYASDISLNLLFASSRLSGFLSGCHFNANFLYLQGNALCLINREQRRLPLCRRNNSRMSLCVTENATLWIRASCAQRS